MKISEGWGEEVGWLIEEKAKSEVGKEGSVELIAKRKLSQGGREGVEMWVE